MDERYITVSRAAAIRGCGVNSIYNLVAAKRLRSKRTDGRRMILRSDVEGFVKKSGRPRKDGTPAQSRNGKA